VIRKSSGFGTLTYFGADLTGAPLADWRDRGLLVSRLLESAEAKSRGTTASHTLMHPGYYDLSGQIRSALDRFDGVATTPFSLILVLIVIYILVIGPADWFIVHKVLKRPRLTWCTFPLWILLFCGLAFTLGAGNRTQPLMVNSVSLIDVAPCDNLVRVTSWGNIYSPKDARYDVSFGGEVADIDLLWRMFMQFDLHWLGLSGSGLGGMEPKTVSLDLWDEPYSYDVQNALPIMKNVPMRVRTTKSFFGQWTSDTESRSPMFSGMFENTSLRSTDGIPAGTLTNEFPFPLENAILVYGHWALKLGRLESGQSVSLGTGTMRRELRLLLNSTQGGLEEDLYAMPGRQAISYNPQSPEIWPILRTMTFFKTFGGFDNVGLHNTLHPHLDWSSVLATNRAILIAQVASDDDSNDARICIKESESGEWLDTPGRRLTVVRVVLPVN